MEGNLGGFYDAHFGRSRFFLILPVSRLHVEITVYYDMYVTKLGEIPMCKYIVNGRIGIEKGTNSFCLIRSQLSRRANHSIKGIGFKRVVRIPSTAANQTIGGRREARSLLPTVLL